MKIVKIKIIRKQTIRETTKTAFYIDLYQALDQDKKKGKILKNDNNDTEEGKKRSKTRIYTL